MEHMARLAWAVVALLAGGALPNLAGADPINCAAFWSAGSPLTVSPEHECVEFPEPMDNDRIRAFTMPGFLNGDRYAAVSNIIEAADESMRAFDQQGRMGSVYILFGDEDLPMPPERSTPIPMGVVSDWVWPSGGEPCPLLIFPYGFEGWDPDQTRQMVAHELFHCFQLTWFHDQLVNPVSGSAAWWSEGTATYFINAPYPDGNLEHLPQSEYAPGLSLLEQSYSNTGFFQSLKASGIGRDGLVAFMSGMPTSGGPAEQGVALSAFPGIDRNFHRFGEQYLDNSIPDDDGGPMGILPEDSPVQLIDESDNFSFEFEPFTLSHHTLRFAAGADYRIEVRELNGIGHESQRTADAPGNWTDLPDQVEAACEHDEDRLFLATSTDLPGTPRQVLLTVAREPRDECCDSGANLDPMLIGTWRAEGNDLIEQVYPGPGSSKSKTGSITVRIDENGQFAQRYEGFGVTMVRVYRNATTRTFIDATEGVVHGCLTAEPMGAMGALSIKLLNRTTSISRTHSSADANPMQSNEEHIGLAFGVPGGGTAFGLVKPVGPDSFYNKKVLYQRVADREE